MVKSLNEKWLSWSFILYHCCFQFEPLKVFENFLSRKRLKIKQSLETITFNSTNPSPSSSSSDLVPYTRHTTGEIPTGRDRTGDEEWYGEMILLKFDHQKFDSFVTQSKQRLFAYTICVDLNFDAVDFEVVEKNTEKIFSYLIILYAIDKTSESDKKLLERPDFNYFSRVAPAKGDNHTNLIYYFPDIKHFKDEDSFIVCSKFFFHIMSISPFGPSALEYHAAPWYTDLLINRLGINMQDKQKLEMMF